MKISFLNLPNLSPDNPALTFDPVYKLGAFVAVRTLSPAARHVVPLGKLVDMRRFLALRRYEPFWMLPQTGKTGDPVPIETQFLLLERADGSCALIAPLVDDTSRACVQSSESDPNELVLVIETGDSQTTVSQMDTAAFVAEGDDPYRLIHDSARAVQNRLGLLHRDDKLSPGIGGGFGWCTWDAFYQDVSHDKVREGLESFKAIGIEPRYLILDDGWQSVEAKESGERRLTSFAANEKFSGDLAATVKMAKTEFKISKFLVWHAIGGYWGGVDGEKLPGYGVVDIERRLSPGVKHYGDGPEKWWGKTVGVVPPQHLYPFYRNYYRTLANQGVDGVKVDVQASLEMLAEGLGGRVAYMRAARKALKGSTAVHFVADSSIGSPLLINCMSCSTEMLYSADASTRVRTSTDFWPNRPESHGLHLWTNAAVSLWFGEFVQPDWDMFQSGHAAGAYHAAGRALSGGPVYVSDKPGAHNPDVLKRLVLPDGRVVGAWQPGVPTRETLFADPTKDDVLLKIRTSLGGDYERFIGQLGLFNARYDPDRDVIVDGDFGPVDVIVPNYDPDYDGEETPLSERTYAAYRHTTGEVFLMAGDERHAISLPPLGWEIVTFIEVQHQVTELGIEGLFNGAAEVTRHSGHRGEPSSSFFAHTIGTVLLHCPRSPLRVRQLRWSDDTPIGELAFTFDAASGLLRVTPPEGSEGDRFSFHVEVELEG